MRTAGATALQQGIWVLPHSPEHDLQKLYTWLEKIRARDFFGAPQARAAAEALTACERALRDFAEAIYAREGLQGHIADERGS
jgi:hypothetical protein